MDRIVKALELALQILERDGVAPLRGEAWHDGERERIREALAIAVSMRDDE